MARKVFYSFQYKPDSQRAAKVRNIGAVEGNKPVSDNDWEKVTSGKDPAIKKWIAGQLEGKSCAVVLIGATTAGRKWISYEISEAWNAKKGVVGIHVNRLTDLDGNTASKGGNPFDSVTFTNSKTKLSTVVKTYTPTGTTSKDVYDWISKNLAAVVEDAIKIRNDN